MLNLSYTLTPKLRVNIDQIDRVRQKILLLPLSREKEFRLKWSSKISRAHSSLSMSGNPLKRVEIAKLVSGFHEGDSLNKAEEEVLNQFKVQEYIDQYWYTTNKTLTPKHIYKLYSIATGLKKTAKPAKKYKPFIDQFLGYIEKGDEHPAIKAGIAQIQLRLLSPFANHNGRITRLLSQLYLTKYNYDMRGFLSLDDYWKKHINRYKQETDVAVLDKSITGWLEFYTEAVLESGLKALEKAHTDRKVKGVERKFWKLTKRQKEILSILDNPDIHLTNRDVVEHFRVSQVTASRELSKMHTKGFIFRRGHGRSVYYTKV